MIFGLVFIPSTTDNFFTQSVQKINRAQAENSKNVKEEKILTESKSVKSEIQK